MLTQRFERHVLTLLLALSGCALAADTPDAPCPHCKPLTVMVRNAAGVTVAVTVANFAYNATPLTINVGDTVTWTNTDAAPHTATSDTALFDTGILNTGQSGSFTFLTAGTIPYHCNVHPFMHGTVIVQGPVTPTAPVLANLTATAKVGVPFTYTLTASGTQPITFGATAPTGFSLTGDKLTGTFTATGTVTIPLTATNSVGADSENLVVTVSAATGAADLSGTWNGTVKSTHFNQNTPAQKAEKDTISLALIQSANELTAMVTINGATSAVIPGSGQIGNTNLWVTGTASSKTLVISAQVDKKGATMKGEAILYTPDGAEEITFSAKKQK